MLGQCTCIVVLLNQFMFIVLTEATLSLDSSKETTFGEIWGKNECFRYKYPYRFVTACLKFEKSVFIEIVVLLQWCLGILVLLPRYTCIHVPMWTNQLSMTQM